ncbi:CaiB/BaiF CoA-transferase family protein [soil metagenome]
MPGPLSGIRIVEFAGIGPVPYGGMLLADMGAEVLVIARSADGLYPVVSRGKTYVVADLKSDAGRDAALVAIGNADVLLEGFRPGVMERLGLGPDVALARNPRLIYGRMTGWGQSGPLADRAGHDINYVALTGVLDAVAQESGPARPPLNLLGDFGGGSLFLVVGVLAGLVERATSGKGQVIDAAIVDGVASLFASIQGFYNSGLFSLKRGQDTLAGSTVYYRSYACADGRELAVGAIEPQFRAAFFERIGLPDLIRVGDDGPDPDSMAAVAARLAERPRDAWVELFADSDACVAPVLTIEEAIAHPHNVARDLFVPAPGGFQPAAAPRFSRTPGEVGTDAPQDGTAMLNRWATSARTSIPTSGD